jgi:selenide,water dikinase
MVNHPRPKAGVFAVRQGMPLFKNIGTVLLGQSAKPFKPQDKFLALLTTGSQHAVATRNGLTFDGDWVWRWKNWIDQRFMQRFSDFPEMDRGENEGLLADFGDQMHCGGCGAKVSADLLSEVLAEFFGDAAPGGDAAPVTAPPGRQLLQSVDHLRAFTPDLYIQSRVAVCHAFSDIYACGGSALNAMVMLTLPFAKPEVTRGMLREVMAGIVAQLAEEGAALIGGHTSEGMESSIGLTVNGAVDPNKAWSKTGANAGEVLILTKPLGTGVVLAADMQQQARGNWVDSALTMMMQSNRHAAEVIAGFSVSACTDLTGFGLAGHCREMLLEQGPGLELDVDALPLLPGAADCLAAGVRSTLHEANRQAALVPGGSEVLYDPQTSGGLLFSLPSEEAADCLAALRQAGYPEAAIIGVFADTSGLSVSGG